MTLKAKLVLFTLTVVVLPLGFIGYYSMHVASRSLEKQSFSKLEALRDAKKLDLENRVGNWFQNISSFAGSKDVYNALVMLRDSYMLADPGKPYDTSDEELLANCDYAAPALKPAVEKLGFSDALLIDDQGRVCLTVQRHADWGDDLLKGRLSGTKLAQALRKTLDGKVTFADFAPYPPQGNVPTAFVLAPIYNHTGDHVDGALAFQIPESNINSLMNTRTGMGHSGRSYLVGPDGLLRSDIVCGQLQKRMRDSFTDTTHCIDSTAFQKAMAGETGALIMPDTDGEEMLSAFTPVHVGDTTWALISEIRETEAFAPVIALHKTTAATQIITLLVVLAATLLFLKRQIFRPLTSLERYAQRVAGGDYAATVQKKLPPELARVRDSLTSMVSNIQTQMEEVNQARKSAQQQAHAARQAQSEAEEASHLAQRAKSEGLTLAADTLEQGIADIATAIEELRHAVSNTNSGADMQKSRTMEIATAMEQMAATIHEMAANSGDAAQGANSASNKAMEGSSVVRDSIESIDMVRDMTTTLNDDMEELSGRVESIGRIMTVINDIADQTNLLALNAAIEAARAGDAGRGFAVVADEVRKLAEKTMTATGEVDEAITAIQEGSRKSATHVHTVGEAVGKATSMVSLSGRALSDIVDMSQSTSDKISTIATAVQQQSATSREIGQGISDVSRVAEETADNARQADHGMQKIQEAADKLEKLNRSLRRQARLDA